MDRKLCFEGFPYMHNTLESHPFDSIVSLSTRKSSTQFRKATQGNVVVMEILEFCLLPLKDHSIFLVKTQGLLEELSDMPE